MHIAPKSLAQLQRSDDAAGIGKQQLERRQLFRGQVNRCFPAQKRTVGFQAEARKRQPRLFRARW